MAFVSATARAAATVAKNAAVSAARTSAKFAGTAARSIAKHSPKWLKATGNIAANGAKGSWKAFRGQSLFTQGLQLGAAGLGTWGFVEMCKGGGDDDTGGDDASVDQSADASIFNPQQDGVDQAQGYHNYAPAGGPSYGAQSPYDSYDTYDNFNSFYTPSQSYIKDDGSYITPNGYSYKVDAKEYSKESKDNPMITVRGVDMPLNEYMYGYSRGLNYNA